MISPLAQQIELEGLALHAPLSRPKAHGCGGDLRSGLAEEHGGAA
jgi:hypothetical protein